MVRDKFFGILSLVFLGFSGFIFGADSSNLSSRHFESYEDTGNEVSIEATLLTAGSTTTVVVPTTVKGFRLYPRTNHIRFSVQTGNTSRVPAAVATDSDGTIAAADLAVGGIAKPDMWETRLLPFDGRARLLYLRSTTTNVVVDIEFF